MEVKHSTLSGMLSGNPTISTLRKIVDAINAMNEEKQVADRCYLAEFFADELPAGFTLSSLAQQDAAAAEPAPKTEATASDELPFGSEPKRETVPGVVVCPHCKGHFVAEITFKAV